MTETKSASVEGVSRSARHELATVLSQVLSATCALLESSEPAMLLGEDTPLARALQQWRRALAGIHGEEAGLLARGRLAEVENERDALRIRQSELLEQLLTLNQRLQAAKRDALGLRFEVDRARAEARQAERELRELRPRGRAAEAEAAPKPPAVEPAPLPAVEPETPSTAVEDSLREELELARSRSEQRGQEARAALDALFTPRTAAAPPERKVPAKKQAPLRKQATPKHRPAPPKKKSQQPAGKTPSPAKKSARKKAPARAKPTRAAQRRVPTTKTTPPQRRRP